jgi:hypothetical protein
VPAARNAALQKYTEPVLRFCLAINGRLNLDLRQAMRMV